AAGATATNSPASAGGPVSPAAGLGATLLLALAGGLILNLMPCVFPVLGIKILGFVNQAGHARSRVVAHGLVFTLGVLLSFWALAAVLAILRAGGDELGWGFQLQSPAFVFVLAALMLVFAMNMSGVFEFGLRATSVGGELQTKSGFAGSFFTGVLATVVATPCSAPFLAPALGAALALSTLESFAIFTAIAIGLATPYLLLSIFPNAVKLLPRPGAWMETFKQFMAFPLYATVGYLVWVLAGQVSEDGLQNVLFGLVLVALAVWFYGRWNAPGASAGRARFGVLALIVTGAAGLWLGWPHTLTAQPGSVSSSHGIVWEPWSPEAVEKLRAEGRTIYVDFTARWCATCQANKKLVFNSDAVLDAFVSRKIATLRADWTSKDPRITAELARYGRSAVPFNVIWKPGQEQPVILPELLTPGTVLGALP
ncbi:MAG TPA: thioredoxin family protein, partial [Opitutus sp.]|nr:thioredoxin family protein [Opitutus sp.]